MMPDPDRTVRVGDLVTLEQIAERCGVGPNAVANWAARSDGLQYKPGMPAPVRDVPRSRLWLWPEVAAWLELTGRTYTITAEL